MLKNSLLVRLDLVVPFDSLGVRRRRTVVVVAIAAAARLVRRGRSGGGGGGGGPVVHRLAVFRLLLLLRLRLWLLVGLGRLHVDVCYAAAVLVVLRYALVVVGLGELGDYVPGVE